MSTSEDLARRISDLETDFRDMALGSQLAHSTVSLVDAGGITQQVGVTFALGRGIVGAELAASVEGDLAETDAALEATRGELAEARASILTLTGTDLPALVIDLAAAQKAVGGALAEVEAVKGSYVTLSGDVAAAQAAVAGAQASYVTLSETTIPALGNLIEGVAARGDNLITNGSGELGDRTNFAGPRNYRFAPERAPVGYPGAFESPVSGSVTSIFADTQVAIDPAQSYMMQGVALGAVGSRNYLAIQMFDVEGFQIARGNAVTTAGTATTLAADLKPGDTTIQLASGTGWAASYPNANLWIGAWPYLNGLGQSFPVGTYTRRTSSIPTGSTRSGNIITLATPWTGPLWAAGTTVTQQAGGDSGLYPVTRFATSEVDLYEGIIGPGAGELKVWPGTAKILPGILLNYSPSAPIKPAFTGLRLIPYAAYKAAQAAQATATAAATAAATADTKAVNAATAAASANSAALAAAGLAGSKGEVIFQASAPTGSRANAANLWIRASDNKPHTYNGSTWVPVESKVATDAAAAAATAKSTADTARTEAASAASAAAAADQKAVNAATAASDAHNAATAAAGAASTAQSKADQAATDAASAAGIAGGKADVLIQSTAPAAAMRKATTLWIDTAGGLNQPKRWTSGTTWVAVTDKAATDAATAAANAQTTATNAATAAAAADTKATNAGTAASQAATAAGNAQTTANTATTTANAKNRVIWSTSAASGTTSGGVAYRDGDIWFRTSGTLIIGQWQYDGSQWQARTVDSAVIANLDAGKITTGTLDAQRIAALSIVAAKIAAGAIIAEKIEAGAVVTDKLAAEAVTAAKIAVGAILAEHIEAGAITAEKLAVGAITAEKIAVDALTGKTITGGTIIGGSIQGVTVEGAGITVPGYGTGPYAASILLSPGSLEFRRPTSVPNPSTTTFTTDGEALYIASRPLNPDGSSANGGGFVSVNRKLANRTYDLYGNALVGAPRVKGSVGEFDRLEDGAGNAIVMSGGFRNVVTDSGSAVGYQTMGQGWETILIPAITGFTRTNTLNDGSAATIQNGLLLLPRPGRYLINAAIRWTGNSAGSARGIAITVNSGLRLMESSQRANGGGLPAHAMPMSTTTVVTCTSANQPVAVVVTQNSGGNLTCRLETLTADYIGPI